MEQLSQDERKRLRFVISNIFPGLYTGVVAQDLVLFDKEYNVVKRVSYPNILKEQSPGPDRGVVFSKSGAWFSTGNSVVH